LSGSRPKSKCGSVSFTTVWWIGFLLIAALFAFFLFGGGIAPPQSEDKGTPNRDESRTHNSQRGAALPPQPTIPVIHSRPEKKPIQKPSNTRDERINWDIRQSAWEQEYARQFKNPRIGATYNLEMLKGHTVKGGLVSVNESAVVLQRGKAQATIYREDLAPSARVQLYQRDYATHHARNRLQQEKESLANENEKAQLQSMQTLAGEYASVKGSLEALRANTTIRVQQVIGQNALCYEGDSSNPIFVYGIGGGLADGDSWRGTLYGVGFYTYLNTRGAPSKVRAYTTIPPARVAALTKKLVEIERKMNDLRNNPQQL